MSEDIFFWRQDKALGNFGDALTLLFLKRLFIGDRLYPGHVQHLVGSVITVNRLEIVRRDAQAAGLPEGRALFWGCGKKDGERLPPDLQRQCRFLGIRGTLSRDALGLPRDTPLGDSALLLPRVYQPRHNAQASGKILWIPHVHHEDPGEQDLDGCPDYLVRRPSIPNSAEACEAFIDGIASARFVMANAMHAAIVALAYGTPFAFWSGSGINVPFKWQDFTSAFGLTLDFHRTYGEAAAAYDRTRPDRAFANLDLEPLLKVAPYGISGR
ncbi:polysaccharide pyruvyl transferase family protein [Sphingobium sp. YR768]|uniref:polysaccharide pyruvyl transferase family protein n=1 Tax=Sphingobium sp. YR768 TaxID=1884365 RepID=UPI0008D073E1|nr:polysaccharide pyruvyl transferase family protein [Sphingobium sp. YR768]SEQ86355.1 Polysaccharide pyruvyl transferase [Sphingobium sp. YR768]